MNLENVKFNNQSAVLRLLNDRGAMSRKDIAEEVGLTAASVTSICTELLEKNIIRELGEVAEEKRAGRKKILVDINPDYKRVLCIAIETDETYISVTDMKGAVVGSMKMETVLKDGPESFLETIAVAVGRVLWDNNISKDMLLGCGVTVPGKVEEKTGVSLGAYSIWKKTIPVKDIVKKMLGTEVYVENNLKAAAMYEILFGRGRNEKNLFLLKWGPGVGSAMIFDGKVYSGANNMAGEIGHTTLGKDGRLCKCGRKGCLELYVSTNAILEDIKLYTGDAKAYKKDISRLADDAVMSLMDEKMDRLAQTLRNTVSFIDPNRVVVLGDIFEIPGILDRFKGIYKQYDDSVEEDFIVKSGLDEIKGHVAPISMVLDDFLNYKY